MLWARLLTAILGGVLGSLVGLWMTADAGHASNNSWSRKNVEVQIYMPESRYLSWVVGVNSWEADTGISFNPVNMGEASCSNIPMKEDKVRICIGIPDNCPEPTNSACTFRKTDGHEILGCKIWVVDPLANGTVFTQLLAMHEMGHCIGLNHNPDGESVMCGTPGCLGAGDVITEHDHDAVRNLYDRNGGSAQSKHRHHSPQHRRN